MRSYLVIESGSTLGNPDVDALFDQCRLLLDAGHQVTVFLVQNAVIGLGRSDKLMALIAGGCRAFVDEHSLRSRMLDEGQLGAGMRLGSMTELVRMMMTPGVVPIWH